MVCIVGCTWCHFKTKLHYTYHRTTECRCPVLISADESSMALLSLKDVKDIMAGACVHKLLDQPVI